MSWIMAPEPRGPGGDRSRRPSRVKTGGAATSLGRRCSCLPLAPVVHPPPGRSLVPTLAARHIAKSFGGQVVLDDVSVTVGPSARLAVVGPNGIGKSTLLRLLAGVEEPDRGSVTRTPATLNVGYLPQEPEGSAGESVLGHLARRTGVAGAEQALVAEAAALAADGGSAAAESAYAAALERFLVVGGTDFEARAATILSDLGLPGASLHLDVGRLSGGQAARVSLAAILLSRADVLLLDEPTNN